MFKNLLQRIREGLYKMGLLSGVKKVTERDDIIASETMFAKIQDWKNVYSGYVPAWHDVTTTTVGGSKNRKRESLGMGKVVAAEMANLVFNEKCEISIADDAFKQEIADVLKQNGFTKEFQDLLERMFALGGGAIEITADERIRLDYVAADAFIPLADDGRRVTEGIFVRESHKGGKKYTRLRFHTWETDPEGVPFYLIRNRLYETDTNKDELGVEVPLARLYPGIKETAAIYGLEDPLFIYLKPNVANHIDMTSKLGVSIYAGALPTIKALDIAFDSFTREFILGKKRIKVPTSAIRTVVDPANGTTKRYFDANDEVYQAFNSETDEFKDISLELRVDEHIAAIDALLNLLAMQTGFSPGAFSFDGAGGVKTATEIISENSKTYRTRAGHVKLVEDALIDLVNAIGKLGELYEFFEVPAEYDVSINFDDSIAEDRQTNTNYWISLASANIGVPKSLALQKILKVTKEEALVMIQEAAAENKTITPDLADLYGGSGE